MKKTTKTDFRVVVYPSRLGDYGIVSMSDSILHRPDEIEKEYLERCPFCPVWKGENESIHDVLAAYFQSAYRNHTP